MGGEHLRVDWGLCWASKKEAILAGRQKRAVLLESEKRFWLVFMENLIGNTFIPVLRKQTVMQDKEGDYLGKAITKPSDGKDPR